MNGLRRFRDPRSHKGVVRCAPRAAGPGEADFNWTIRPADGIRATSSVRTGLAFMKLFFLKLFTWWNGQTFGTQLWTWRFGELVGKDERATAIFRTKGRK